MTQAVLNRLDDFSEGMLLHYSSPNRNIIAEVLQFDASQLTELTQQQLSKYLFALGQYLVMLQYNENVKNIEYKLAQKSYEYRLNKEKFQRDDIVGKSEKAKEAWVLINVPEIRELHEELVAKEAEKLLIEGMVRPVEGLLNALKKEASLRSFDGYNG